VQIKVSDRTGHEMSTEGADTPIRREIENVLRRRMWIHPEQVGASVRDGVATLTGAVGRLSTARIATRLTAAVPGVTHVIDRIRYDFDDTDLVRSKVSRTHPFSADPFAAGRPSRRLNKRSRRMPVQGAPPR
jgi:BON domain-containing protein